MAIRSLLKSVLLVAFAFAATGAHASGDLTGSYRGAVQGDHSKTRVDLILRSLSAQDRDGSYMAILFQSNPLKVAAYLVDPLDRPDHYSMVPREITADGQIEGVNNPDPSLELIVDDSAKGQAPKLSIVNANSSNKDFFQGSILFDGHD